MLEDGSIGEMIDSAVVDSRRGIRERSGVTCAWLVAEPQEHERNGMPR